MQNWRAACRKRRPRAWRRSLLLRRRRDAMSSIAPMAKRLALGECDQLHHFIAAGVWDATPVETELLVQADRLVGGSDAVLVIDDTAIPKKGTYSVGVAAQYATALGKTAN